jgi:hypothetical protein
MCSITGRRVAEIGCRAAIVKWLLVSETLSSVWLKLRKTGLVNMKRKPSNNAFRAIAYLLVLNDKSFMLRNPSFVTESRPVDRESRVCETQA